MAIRPPASCTARSRRPRPPSTYCASAGRDRCWPMPRPANSPCPIGTLRRRSALTNTPRSRRIGWPITGSPSSADVVEPAPIIYGRSRSALLADTRQARAYCPHTSSEINRGGENDVLYGVLQNLHRNLCPISGFLRYAHLDPLSMSGSGARLCENCFRVVKARFSLNSRISKFNQINILSERTLEKLTEHSPISGVCRSFRTAWSGAPTSRLRRRCRCGAGLLAD